MQLLFGCRKSAESSQSKAIRKACLQLFLPRRLSWVLHWPEENSSLIGKRIYKAVDAVPYYWPYLRTISEWISKYCLQRPHEPTMKDFVKRFPRRDHARLGLCHHPSWRVPPTPARLIWAYSEFPVFGRRLRELRLHMDKQKPLGVQELLRDKRDSLAYYTFWGAVLAGSITIFLTIMALGVSALQAWAS